MQAAWLKKDIKNKIRALGVLYFFLILVWSCKEMAPEREPEKGPEKIECDKTIDCLVQAKPQQFLTEAQKDKATKIISKAIDNIENQRPGNGIPKFYTSTRTVFILDDLPGLIFKKARNIDEAEDEVEKNSRKAQFAACEAKRCGLNRLVIPKVESLKVIANGKEYYFTAEQKLDLRVDSSSFYAHQNELYNQILSTQSDNNKFLKFEELFNQLTVFALNTNFSDFKFDNLPLLKSSTSDEPQMGVVDLESIQIAKNVHADAAQRMINNIILPYVFIDSVAKTVKDYTQQDILWPSFEKDVERYKLDRKQNIDYFTYLQNKGYTYEKMFSNPINLKKGSPLLQCQLNINRFANTERDIAKQVNNLLDYAINWGDKAPRFSHAEGLMSVRFFTLSDAILLPPLNTTPGASKQQKDFMNSNAQFIQSVLNMPSDKHGWEKNFCKALAPVLKKAEQNGDIFSHECKVYDNNGTPSLRFRIWC